MFKPLLQSLQRQPTWRILALACALLAVLAYLDWITGVNLRIGIFYLLPIALVTLFVGRLPGAIMAFLSAGVWFWAESMGHVAGAYGTAIVRLLFFQLAVLMLSTWREIG